MQEVDRESAKPPKPYRQQLIEDAVHRAIAQFGFNRAIPELMLIVHAKGSTATDDPYNAAKTREFMLWSQAVRDACANQVNVMSFNDRITEFDLIRARGLGVSLR